MTAPHHQYPQRRHSQSSRLPSRGLRLGAVALILAMIASALMLILAAGSSTPADAQGRCASLTVSQGQLTGGSTHCYYVVTEAFGSWDQACKGIGTHIDCRGLEIRSHKVEVFQRSPWKKIRSYRVTPNQNNHPVPTPTPLPIPSPTQCVHLGVSGDSMSGGDADCYYVVTEAFGSWDQACRGVGGSLTCNNLARGTHKVDVFQRSPWKKLPSYTVTIRS